MIINKDEIEFSSQTPFDEIGRVFFWNGRLFRGIYDQSLDHVKELFKSGLVDELVGEKILPKTWITNYEMEGFSLIIEHELINNLTYPYEWSFNMLKDAAITMLKTNVISMKYGYQTKDAHGFNIVFNNCQPMFVDLGSLVKIPSDYNGWIALEQFIRFFYYPLDIWSKGNYYFAQTALSCQNGIIPHESYLLYRSPILRNINIKYLERAPRIYFAIKNLSLYPDKKLFDKLKSNIAKLIIGLRNKGILPFQKVNFYSLIKKIERINYNPPNTMWKDYHNQYIADDGTIKSSIRFQRIAEIIKSLDIHNLCELAGNQGIFSRFLLEQGMVEQIVCSDYDHNAVDIMYLMTKENKIKCTPTVLNFVNPITTTFGKPPNDRFKADAVVALAVTHHLVLTQNIPIETILKILKQYTRKHVFVEFMPMGLYDGKESPPTPDWYNIDWFRNSFIKFFDILLEEMLEENRYLFVGIIK